jgi:glycerol-1-phosphate dehydrogenase [NAD(P)+]
MADRRVKTPSRAAGGDALAQLLGGTWLDPDGGPPIGVPVLAVAIERSLAGSEADLVGALPVERRFGVVCDVATEAVQGARVMRALASLGPVTPVVLDAAPHADLPTVERVRDACAGVDTLIAVGSGTINDLAKYAAAQDGKPYAVFATAPSMNGYTSMNASITVDGHKSTLPAVAPLGVYLDLGVLAAAPARLIRSGLGDSLARSTAQVDWLLSHELLGTPYRRAPFALLAGDEPALLECPEALLGGDLDAMRALARTLVLSGLGMTICHGSYPASQGEHLISHYVEMFAPPARAAYLHGEQVGVTTLTMARLQEAMLKGAAPRLVPCPVTSADLHRHFGADAGDACWKEFSEKRLTQESAPQLTHRAAAIWADLRAAFERIAIPAATIESTLRRAGCPSAASDIGVDDGFYESAVRNARYLRNRYTFLDLAADAGRLAPA